VYPPLPSLPLLRLCFGEGHAGRRRRRRVMPSLLPPTLSPPPLCWCVISTTLFRVWTPAAHSFSPCRIYRFVGVGVGTGVVVVVRVSVGLSVRLCVFLCVHGVLVFFFFLFTLFVRHTHSLLLWVIHFYHFFPFFSICYLVSGLVHLAVSVPISFIATWTSQLCVVNLVTLNSPLRGTQMLSSAMWYGSQDHFVFCSCVVCVCVCMCGCG
jgi:hypothetical protein